MTHVFFDEETISNGVEVLESRQREAIALLEVATLKVTIARLIWAGGHAIHCNFDAGSEPRWMDECQRESIIELSKMINSAHSQIFGDDAT